MSTDATRLKGRISKWLGLATGDRKAEASGNVQERDGHKPSRSEVRAETKRVKAEHHDYGDRVPPQQVPHTDR